ncbi:hypothetical protein ACWD2L_06205 [Streptomyces sp. NPDC002754]
MTDEEFDSLRKEIAAYVKTTTFPAPVTSTKDKYEAHSHHAEFESSRH